MKSRSGKTTTLLGNAGGAADAPTAPRAAVAASAAPTRATASRRRLGVGVSVRDGADRKRTDMRLLEVSIGRSATALRCSPDDNPTPGRSHRGCILRPRSALQAPLGLLRHDLGLKT